MFLFCKYLSEDHWFFSVYCRVRPSTYKVDYHYRYHYYCHYHYDDDDDYLLY